MSNSNLDRRLAKIEKTLMRNTLSLEEHMKRTALLEEEVKQLRKTEISRSSVGSFFDTAFKSLVSLVAVLVGLKNLNLLKF
jgi:hypothetical protein